MRYQRPQDGYFGLQYLDLRAEALLAARLLKQTLPHACVHLQSGREHIRQEVRLAGERHLNVITSRKLQYTGHVLAEKLAGSAH